MTMTLDELKEAVADICAGCDSERSQFTNADLGDAIDAAIRERDRLRGDVDGLRDCVERAQAELAEARKNETVALGLWNAAEGRATKAEAELAALKDENAQLRDVLADRDMDREMAAHANKELAAIKARIGASRLIEPGAQFPVPGYVGKRVRMLVED